MSSNTQTPIQTSTKDERINLRLKHNSKLMIERAASFEGKTVSKFILSSALEHAERTIQEHDVMALSIEDSQAFFDALSAPVQFNQKLTAAIKEHEQRVTSK